MKIVSLLLPSEIWHNFGHSNTSVYCIKTAGNQVMQISGFYCIWKHPEQSGLEMILMPLNSEKYYESQKKSLEESKVGNTAKFA